MILLDYPMTSLSDVCDTLPRWLNQAPSQMPDWPPEIWKTFKFVCRVHGVAPLLHETLRECEWLDDSIKSWLAEQYQFNVRRIAKMHADLAEILALFEVDHIPLMPLKGSILSVTFYKEPGLRPMADLDLLIQPQDLAASISLLGRLGYEQEVVHWKHTSFIKPDNRRVVSTQCEHPDNPRGLELHLFCRETFGGPAVDLTTLMWHKAGSGKLLGEKAVVPAPEALWLHLVVHATYHLWQGQGRLIHLVDLAQVTPHLDDPPAVLNTVDARFTYPSLALLKNHFPAAIDEALLADQKKRVSTSFQQWVASLDLVNTSHLNPGPPGLYLSKALRFTGGRPLEVGQALRFALLPSLAEIALDHPRLAASKTPWLAYFLLPLDWARRLIRSR